MIAPEIGSPLPSTTVTFTVPWPSRFTSTAVSSPASVVPEDEQAKGEFAVDVGGAVNFDGLRVLWNSSRNANSVLFEGLQPLVAVRESKSRGVDLRLIFLPRIFCAFAADLPPMAGELRSPSRLVA